MRRPLAALLCVLGLALACAPAAGAYVLGIGDQQPAMFTDPQFAALNIHRARIVVPWDVLTHPDQLHDLDAWMQAAQAAGAVPLLSFSASRIDRHALPSPRRLQIVFRLLRDRYPQATEWTTWNEANHCSQPVCHKPELVARFYDALSHACPSCQIAGVEVLDQPNMVDYVERLQAAATVPVRIWGLHNYLDANRRRTSGTLALLAHTTGQVWFTETGGIVSRNNNSTVAGFPESPDHAAQADRWVLETLARLSPRIRRVYLYGWLGQGRQATWDSGLLTPGGRPRPALTVLRDVLGARLNVPARP